MKYKLFSFIYIEKNIPTHIIDQINMIVIAGKSLESTKEGKILIEIDNVFV